MNLKYNTTTITGILLLAVFCNLVHGDYGWSDSDSFSLNLLAVESLEHDVDWSDSRSFAMDLLWINRVWADSGDFLVDNVSMQLVLPGYPEQWFDQDKYHLAGEVEYGDSWTHNWYDDENYSGYHEVGESWDEQTHAEWVNPQYVEDKSCWMAAADNILRYVGGSGYYDGWAYNTGVNTFWGVRTFDDAGNAEEAWDAEGFEFAGLSSFLGWLTNPIDWTVSRLQRNLPVAASMAEADHTITIYAIDTVNSEILTADSDTDNLGLDYYLFPYNYNGVKWQILGFGEITLVTSLLPYDWAGSGTGGDDSITGPTTVWNDAANWSTLQIPSNKDMAEILFENDGKVSIKGTADCFRLDINGYPGRVELESGAILDVQGHCLVGNSHSGSFNQSGGLHTIGGNLYIANSNVSISDYNLSGGVLTASSEYIGVEGEGWLEQSDGINVADDFIYLGYSGSSTGTYEISGGLLSAGSFIVGKDGYGILDVTDNAASIEVKTCLKFGRWSKFKSVPASTIRMTCADLEIFSNEPSKLNGLSNTTFIFEGGHEVVDRIEVASEDMGRFCADFNENFSIYALSIGDNNVGRIQLVDYHDNIPQKVEALYVKYLFITVGSELDLNGISLYYESLIDEGGKIIYNGGGKLVQVGKVPIGDLTCDGKVDFVDFSVFASSWASKLGDIEWNPDCDISKPSDGVIDELDLNILVDYWLEGNTP